MSAVDAAVCRCEVAVGVGSVGCAEAESGFGSLEFLLLLCTGGFGSEVACLTVVCHPCDLKGMEENGLPELAVTAFLIATGVIDVVNH